MPTDPLPAAIERGLRAEVLALKRRGARGHLPLQLGAGQPGAVDDGAARFEAGLGRDWDQHTRTEVAVALGNRLGCGPGDPPGGEVPAPMLWVSRSGDLELSPNDLSWLSAGRAAWAELGWAPSFALVTRTGWLHQPSDRMRVWRRLRG